MSNEGTNIRKFSTAFEEIINKESSVLEDRTLTNGARISVYLLADRSVVTEVEDPIGTVVAQEHFPVREGYIVPDMVLVDIWVSAQVQERDPASYKGFEFEE